MTKILVIEDEAHILDSLVEMLQFEGFEATGARNGEIGLYEAYRLAPDLIISDITMPETPIDGFVLLQELRSNARTATIPLIFLTARTEREDFRQGMSLGADDYVTKPFTSADLLGAISAVLKRRSTITSPYEERLDALQHVLSHTLPHELRTPLTSIIGYSEYLTQQPAQLSADEIDLCGTAIYRAGQRLYHLIENYLLYMRLSFAKHEHPIMHKLREHYIDQPTYPAERLIRETTETAEKYKRPDDLHLDIDPQASVQLSSEDIGRIVGELVDNAFKFSAHGAPVEVTAKIVENGFTVRVTDRGIGMSEEELAHIGPYTQFRRQILEQQGLGLGLVIARGLTEFFGGSFEIVSQPNQGTLVTIKFPILS